MLGGMLLVIGGVFGGSLGRSRRCRLDRDRDFN
jgi:hypothetical protein